MNEKIISVNGGNMFANRSIKSIKANVGRKERMTGNLR